MRGAGAYAVSDGFETLADSYNEGAWDRGTIDPVAREVLRLEAVVGRGLEEVGC